MKKPPRNYKTASKMISGPEAFDGLPWGEYLAYIQKELKAIEKIGGIDPYISHDWIQDYGPDEYYAIYFVPMDDSEIEANKLRNAKRKEAAKLAQTKRLDRERKEYERLKKKFEK